MRVSKLFIVGYLAISFISCDKVKNNDTYKIGAVVFLTGQQSMLGQEIKNSIDIAVEDYNKQFKERKIEVIYEDSKDNANSGIMAFNKLINSGISIVITTGDVVSLSIAPIAKREKVIQIATVAANSDLTRDNDMLIRVWPMSVSYGKKIAGFAINNLRIKKTAILFINNEYGISSSNGFKDEILLNNGTVINKESFEISDKNLKPQIIKILSDNPDAIYITGFGTGYANAIKQIRELKFKGIILTDNTISINYFFEQTKGYNEGIYFVSTLFGEESNNNLVSNYIKKYKELHKNDPSFLGAFGYDSVQILFNAIDRIGTNNESIKNYIFKNKFNGLNGVISYDDNREIDFQLVVKQVIDGQVKIIREIDK